MQPKTPKPKKCAVCKAEFTSHGGFVTWCGFDCGVVLATARLGKAKRKAAKEKKVEAVKERKETKARREKQKTPSAHEKECREIVQEIARIRDRNDGCISCHMPANYNGLWHGSHFRPAGNNAAVQFHLWNIHKACAQCNLFKGGNLSQYRPRLVEKIGEARVQWLESQTQVVKTNVSYTEKFKKVMGKRLRRIKKQLKANQ